MERADEILNRFKTAEKEAFELLYDVYYETLVLFANSIVGDADAAEDIVQESFVKLWLTRRYKTLESGLDKYMFQMVKHGAYNYLRDSNRKQNLHERAWSEYGRVADADKAEVELLEKIYYFINQLPAERREIFLQVFAEGKSYQEAADALGISKNTVKTQLARALQFLRNELKDKYNLSLLIFLMKKNR